MHSQRLRLNNNKNMHITSTIYLSSSPNSEFNIFRILQCSYLYLGFLFWLNCSLLPFFLLAFNGGKDGIQAGMPEWSGVWGPLFSTSPNFDHLVAQFSDFSFVLRSTIHSLIFWKKNRKQNVLRLVKL